MTGDKACIAAPNPVLVLCLNIKNICFVQMKRGIQILHVKFLKEEEDAMTDNKSERNLDPERMDQHESGDSTSDKKFNAGDNDSDYDGGHAGDTQSESGDHTKNGESYARRQHGKDEIGDKSFNEGDNDSDYDGGHPKDGTHQKE